MLVVAEALSFVTVQTDQLEVAKRVVEEDGQQLAVKVDLEATVLGRSRMEASQQWLEPVAIQQSVQVL